MKNRRARILVFTHFFAPESGAASHRTSALVACLVARGHAVTVIAPFANWPAGVFASDDRALFRTEWLLGSRVFRYRIFVSPAFSKRNRILTMLTTAVGATIALAIRRPRADLIFVSSPPITLAVPALLASFFGRVPLAVDIRDVYPEVAVRMGEWRKDSLLTRFIGKIAERLYARASIVSTVTPSCVESIVARGADPAKVFLIRNGYDWVGDLPIAPYGREAGDFVVSYAGNMGVANGVGIILDAAHRLSALPGLRFVLAGGGAQRDAIESRIAREAISNVTLLGALERELALAVVAGSDLCVVPLRKHLNDSLPTKLLDAMSLERPVVVCADGEARQMVVEAGCGIAVEPEDAAALAGAIRAFYDDRERGKRLGLAGRRFVEGRFERLALMRELCAILEATLGFESAEPAQKSVDDASAGVAVAVGALPLS